MGYVTLKKPIFNHTYAKLQKKRLHITRSACTFLIISPLFISSCWGLTNLTWHFWGGEAHIENFLKLFLILACFMRQSDNFNTNCRFKCCTRVNFTNILCVAYLYESFARSFFVLAVKVQLFICTRILEQMR